MLPRCWCDEKLLGKVTDRVLPGLMQVPLGAQTPREGQAAGWFSATSRPRYCGAGSPELTGPEGMRVAWSRQPGAQPGSC